MSATDGTLHSREPITIEEVDRTLDRVANTCAFSSSEIRNTAILSNRLAETIPALVPKALTGSGLPVSSVPAFLKAYTVGTPAAFATVEGLTPSILAAGARAYKVASAQAYSTVFYSTIAFSCVALILAFFTPGVYLAAAGVFPAISNILPWVLNNQGNDTKRGVGLAILQMVGQCGPILGTRIYPKSQSPYYVKGMSICAGFMFFNALLAMSLRTYLQWLNKKAERAEVAVGEEVIDEKAANIGIENEGAGWRNIL